MSIAEIEQLLKAGKVSEAKAETEKKLDEIESKINSTDDKRNLYHDWFEFMDLKYRIEAEEDKSYRMTYHVNEGMKEHDFTGNTITD